MATLNATGHKLILEKRRFDDYASMKQYFQNSDTKEVLFAGTQLLTAAYATLDGSDHTIAAQVSAEDVVYISTIADDATQQGKSLWTIYQDDTGAIQDVVLSKFDAADSSTEIVLGANGTGQTDTVAAVNASTLTMTATAATLNQFAGWYTVGISGDGDQIGVANLIVSNTAHATTPDIVLTDAPNADTATDIISIQQYPHDDFYRAREMYCEVEGVEAKTIRLGNVGSTAIYGGIGEGHRYMANCGIFTQPSATCDTYFGFIRVSTLTDSTVTEAQGAQVKIFYTPAEAHANGGAVETELEISLNGTFDWQPCIRLEPATDVVVQVKDAQGEVLEEIFVETAFLEVYK